MPESFLFGLLDQPSRPVTFAFGEVRPLVPDIHSRVRDWGEKHGHSDGWLYLSTQRWKRAVFAPDGSEVEEDWPTNEPKPEVWTIERTHELALNSMVAEAMDMAPTVPLDVPT